jgi:hypothetical protein
VDLNQNFSTLADDALATYAAQVRAAFNAIAEQDAPTEAQVTEAEGYADHLDAISTEQASRVEKAAALAARRSALRSRFGNDDATQTPDEREAQGAEVDAEEEAEEADSEDTVPTTDVDAEPKTESRGGVVTLARKVKRPPAPVKSRNPVTILAAADVPQFATGSKIENLEVLSTALVNRMRGFQPPTGDGVGEDLRHFGVASLALDFPKDLTIDRHSDDMEVLTRASQEDRLPGGSLVAAGGWCAPSETIYDLCAQETTDGLISVPEVNVARGGIKYTRGPDFADIFTDASFCQTEAQAIAGTTKPCVEVECPPFVEVRLEACGVCIKAPILTNAAYPELVQRYTSGTMIAHQHKMSIKVINAIIAGSTAKTATGLGAVATDTLEALTLYADVQREKWRLSLSASFEVILPFWVRDVIKADISRRQGTGLEDVSDAQVDAAFRSRKLNVQYVYGLDALGDVDTWPADFTAVMYPAGTWVKGVANIINLNAVYDAASLAVNTYTAVFMEQGILTAKMCNDSLAVTIPVCAAGRSGAGDITCAATP